MNEQESIIGLVGFYTSLRNEKKPGNNRVVESKRKKESGK